MPSVLSRLFALQTSSNHIHIGLSLCNRHPGFEPCNHAEKVTAAIQMNRLSNGHPKLRAFARYRIERKLELRRHDADNGVTLIIQCDIPSDHALVSAKATLPKTVTQNYNTIRAGSIFFGQECAA